MLPSWADDTVTVLEPTWVTERGKDVPRFDPPASTTTVPGCSVQPGGGSEDGQARQNVIVRWTVYAPAGVTVTAHSAVEHDGARYSVDGPPERWKSPTGVVSHTVLRLVDWKG